MTSTMERFVSARAMVAIAHRSLCEADKLQAEGRPADNHAKKSAPNGYRRATARNDIAPLDLVSAPIKAIV